MPLNQLLGLTKTDSRTSIKNAADKLLCNGVININLGFKTPLGINQHWLYFPEDSVPWYRIGFWHNIAPSLTPAGKSAIYSEFSYLPQKTSQQHLDQIIDTAQKKLLSFFGLDQQAIDTQHVFNIKHAYVIYDLWREKNISKLLDQLKANNVHSVGRYGAWKYSSMQEAFLDGKITAEALQYALASKRTQVFPALHGKKEKQKQEIKQPTRSLQ